jgi:hypothetical protein
VLGCGQGSGLTEPRDWRVRKWTERGWEWKGRGRGYGKMGKDCGSGVSDGNNRGVEREQGSGRVWREGEGIGERGGVHGKGRAAARKGLGIWD